MLGKFCFNLYCFSYDVDQTYFIAVLNKDKNSVTYYLCTFLHVDYSLYKDLHITEYKIHI